MRRRALNRSRDVSEIRRTKARARDAHGWALIRYYCRWSDWVVEAFKAFGRHCARNQIRVLLIDSFVMTTLFYPALALHMQRTSIHNANLNQRHSGASSTRTTGPLSLLSTPLLDSFFPYSAPVVPVPKSRPFWADGEWTQYFDFEVESKAKGNQSCDVLVSPVAWTTMQQVVGLSPWTNSGASPEASTGGVEEPSSRQFRQNMERLASNWDSMTGGDMACVKWNNGSSQSTCLSFGAEMEPNDIYQTFQPVFRTVQESPGLVERFKGAWGAALEDVSEEVEGQEYDYGGLRDQKAIVYGMSPHKDTAEPRSTSKSIPSYIFLLYAAVILYFLFLLSRASAMHSRFGIAFTGVIQVLCSAVMSFSVMAFLGFGWGDAANRNANGETVVPYYLMPLVILIVGVENMATLLKAIYSTPITYSVPDRIGCGLAKAGPTLFITSISDIIALCFIAWTVKLGPVRDLCLYASVLIFVDWWMLQTFFLTVVSIDCQRLELADLLRQGVEQPRKAQMKANSNVKQVGEQGNGAGPTDEISNGRGAKSQKSGWIKGAQSIWKARTARGGSMLVLLSLVTGVYYINESHQKDRLIAALGYGSAKSNSMDLSDLYQQPAPSPSAPTDLPGGIRHIWNGMNPLHQSSISICLLPTRAYIMPSSGIKVKPSQLIGSLQAMNRPLLPRIKPIFYLLKIVVLPQLATAFLLWLVLLYLLKDADLLDAQRERAEVDDVELEEISMTDAGRLPSTRLGQIIKQSEADTIPTIDYTDILQIWTDQSASLVVIADSDNKMRILEDDKTLSVAFATYPGQRDCVHLDRQGKLLAIASPNGKVQIYDMKSNRTAPGAVFTSEYSVATTSSPYGVLVVASSNPFAASWSVVTVHRDGTMLSHKPEHDRPELIDGSNRAPFGGRKFFPRDEAGDMPRFAILASENTVEEWECIGEDGWVVRARNVIEGAIITDSALLSFAGDDFWFTATANGSIQLSTFPDNHVLHQLNMTDQPITQIRVISPQSETCERCLLFKGTLPCDLLYWTDTTVGRSRLSFESPGCEVCMCSRHPGGRASVSRPVDTTPLRPFSSISRKAGQPGSTAKQRSTSPSPLSKHGRLSVENGSLASGLSARRRADSEDDSSASGPDAGLRREWVVHAIHTDLWHTYRGTAILLPASHMLVAISKAKREWQTTFVDLNALGTQDSELSVPVDLVLQSTKSSGNARRSITPINFTRLAFASVKSVAAGANTVLFGQGNTLIRLQLPKPVESMTSLSRRASALFTVPPSANGTISTFGTRQVRTPIPLKLNGNSIAYT